MADNERSSGRVVGKLVGKAKEVAGSVLGNDDLKAEGRIHLQKAQADADAVRAEQSAAQREAEAEVEAKEQELAAEKMRLDAEVAKETEQRRIEALEQAEKARIDAVALGQEAAHQQQEVVGETVIDGHEAQALRERHAAEADAAELSRRAGQARDAAEALDVAANPNV